MLLSFSIFIILSIFSFKSGLDIILGNFTDTNLLLLLKIYLSFFISYSDTIFIDENTLTNSENSLILFSLLYTCIEF